MQKLDLSNETIEVYCDGGARGNPGPAAVGVALYNAAGEPVTYLAWRIGWATNNEAEYMSVILAFKLILSMESSPARLVVRMDSQVVSKQLSGAYRVKEPHLRVLHERAKDLENQLSSPVVYTHVLRKHNQMADKLLNLLLDNLSLK